MNLHEYQGKEIMATFGVPVQRGKLATSATEAVKVAQELSKETGTSWWVIKAQVHAGGRGKAGGIKLAKSLEEVESLSNQIIGMNMVTPQTGAAGKRVNDVLLAEDVYYPGPSEHKEFYLSVLLDRSKGKNVIVYSTKGGMDIEAVAHDFPDDIQKEIIEPSGIKAFQCRKIAFNLGLSGDAFKQMVSFIEKIYTMYIKSDASLVEINPVLKTSDDKILAVDCKMSIDDNALYRQPSLAGLRDTREENPIDVEAGEMGLNFVKLDGNVGCMVNGAGLAMATMDIIKLNGGDPANFLDVGGTADAQRVEAGFKIILRDPNVKAILVNIFGGIVRCDRVAQGIIDAYANMGDQIKVPIIVRLQGTNAELAKTMIEESGLKVHAVITLEDAALKVKEIVGA
ncbi:MAG: ADP-forming succinate--CoA ligase subunit beta [Flavobacteriaceae bacterium]|nr:MAG: ADP-forming succinate--CoA ligase subunit beta [Flavobacteriaceae bacterium]